MKNNIAIFDACGTITKTNNTFHFISYVLKRDNKLRFIRFKLILLFSLFINTLRINKIIKKDIAREWSIKLLKGFSVNSLEKRAEEYINKVEKSHFNKKIIELIKKEKKSKDKTFIISASINPPIKELAKRLGIKNYFSSELEIKNDLYTGRLKKDLFGRKEEAMNLNYYDLKNSSIYSDNLEDKNFMLKFGKIYPVIKKPNKKQWDFEGKTMNFIILKERGGGNKDISSVNEKTIKWIYIPTMYYIVSRFHLRGLVDLFFKEIIPFTLAIYFFTNIGIKSFIIMPLSFIMFYSVYEIGGLYNDLKSPEEKSGKPTLRIKKGIKINLFVFILIRSLFLLFMLFFFNNKGHNLTGYISGLIICLIIYIIHTIIKNNFRLITFSLLKIFRNLIPLTILINLTNFNIIIHIFLSFFLIDSPRRIYVYISKRTKNKLIFDKIISNKITYYSLLTLLGLIITIIFKQYILLDISAYFLILSLIGYFLRIYKF
jgi:HAD superfamily phosphoserine phosphatase-like hydrolase